MPSTPPAFSGPIASELKSLEWGSGSEGARGKKETWRRDLTKRPRSGAWISSQGRMGGECAGGIFLETPLESSDEMGLGLRARARSRGRSQFPSV